MSNQSISLDGSTVVYATEFIQVSETGTSSIQQDFATITYVDNEISNINVQGITQAELDTQLAPIIAQNAGQDLVLTDINNNLTNNFQTTTQLNSNFYSRAQIDTNLSNNYYTKTEIDANNWIDATALTPYATTATLTTNYQTNSQLATNYYNKGEVDGLIAGVSGGGGGVSNPIELVNSNTSIERYTNATKSNISLDLSINEKEAL